MGRRIRKNSIQGRRIQALVTQHFANPENGTVREDGVLEVSRESLYRLRDALSPPRQGPGFLRLLEETFERDEKERGSDG
jgi:hypothetical protein